MTSSGSGRVGGAGGCPTVGAGIVSPAGVQIRMVPSNPPQTIISLPVQTAVCPYRAVGALVSAGCESTCHRVQPTRGTSYYRKLVVGGHLTALAIGIVSRRYRACGICSSAVRRRLKAPSLACAWARLQSAIKRSVKTGLAKHSAMTKGSFPRASNSSRKTSGCLV